MNNPAFLNMSDIDLINYIYDLDALFQDTTAAAKELDVRMTSIRG